MEGLFTLDNFITLGMLTLLQMILGLDNLLYISMESGQAPPSEQKRVRLLGIGIAIVLRIVLLFVLVSLIDLFQDPVFGFHLEGIVGGEFNIHSLIVLATDVFWVMAVAIVIGGVMMIWLAGKVTAFLKKNRMYEVLGLFILFIVGIMLMSEGGHLAHMEFFGSEITPMSKGTFYFVIITLVIIDIVQGRYQKKISGGLN